MDKNLVIPLQSIVVCQDATIEYLAAQIQSAIPSGGIILYCDGTLNHWESLEKVPEGGYLLTEYGTQAGRPYYVLNKEFGCYIYVFDTRAAKKLCQVKPGVYKIWSYSELAEQENEEFPELDFEAKKEWEETIKVDIL